MQNSPGGMNRKDRTGEQAHIGLVQLALSCPTRKRHRKALTADIDDYHPVSCGTIMGNLEVLDGDNSVVTRQDGDRDSNSLSAFFCLRPIPPVLGLR
jgi:hypothetical protein